MSLAALFHAALVLQGAPLVVTVLEPVPADRLNIYRASCGGTELEIAGFGNSVSGAAPVPVSIRFNGDELARQDPALADLLGRRTGAYRFTAGCDRAGALVEVRVYVAWREATGPAYEAGRFMVDAGGARLTGREPAGPDTIWFEPVAP